MNRIVPIILVGATMLATSAFAGTVDPGDVKIEDGTVAQPLTDIAGDAENGKAVFADRKLGNCLACHQNNDLIQAPFHGEVGPEMNGVADRWEPAELRAILVDSKAVFGDHTIMPAFYYNHDETGFRVAEDFLGKTILTAQEVEDVIAYLMTLKEE